MGHISTNRLNGRRAEADPATRARTRGDHTIARRRATARHRLVRKLWRHVLRHGAGFGARGCDLRYKPRCSPRSAGVIPTPGTPPLPMSLTSPKLLFV